MKPAKQYAQEALKGYVWNTDGPNLLKIVEEAISKAQRDAWSEAMDQFEDGVRILKDDEIKPNRGRLN